MVLAADVLEKKLCRSVRRTAAGGGRPAPPHRSSPDRDPDHVDPVPMARLSAACRSAEVAHRVKPISVARGFLEVLLARQLPPHPLLQLALDRLRLPREGTRLASMISR